MNDINKTIKHFESLQKRYTTQHNGQMCDRVNDALEALYRFQGQGARYMHFVTVFEKVEPSEVFFAEFGDQRTWGYYPEYEWAVEALHENVTDIHEGCYEYAVIEKIDYGICAICEKRQWFKWDKEKRVYFEIEEPECVKHLTNFAIG